jgi:hypothetical protein
VQAVLVGFDLHLGEASLEEAVVEAGWVDRHADVVGVQLAEVLAVAAIGTRKQPSRSEDPGHLGEQPVL